MKVTSSQNTFKWAPNGGPKGPLPWDPLGSQGFPLPWVPSHGIPLGSQGSPLMGSHPTPSQRIPKRMDELITQQFNYVIAGLQMGSFKGPLSWDPLVPKGSPPMGVRVSSHGIPWAPKGSPSHGSPPMGSLSGLLLVNLGFWISRFSDFRLSIFLFAFFVEQYVGVISRNK